MAAASHQSVDLKELTALRRQQWRQTPTTRITEPQAAMPLIEEWGIATLFPASSEIPNLFSAHMGEPEPPTDSSHDSPSGDVYSWRWTLGRLDVAFYGVLVRKRPTWIAPAVLPAMLRVRADLRTPDEMFDVGAISADAYRITGVLEAAGKALSTTDLRREAGFPTGKDHRARFLAAIAELDNRMVLAKVFMQDAHDMHHALITSRYADQVRTAESLSMQEGLDHLVAGYLPHAIWVAPTLLARHLGVPESDLRPACDRAAERGDAAPITMPSVKGTCYLRSQR